MTDVRALFVLVPVFCLTACGGGNTNPSTSAYYVDATGGNDGNAGTSSAPWQTLAKVAATSFPSGTTVYLKRGSTWNEQLIVPSSAITIDAYGSGALPTLNGSRQVSSWAAGTGGLYSAAVTLGNGEALGNLSENGTMMSFVPWSTDAATTFASAATGSYAYDYANSTLYIKPAGTPAASTYLASTKLYGISATAMSNVIVKNVNITRFSLHGIHFRDCSSCEVHNATIGQGGGASLAPNVYAGNGIEFGNSSNNGVVDTVTISDIFDSCITPQTYLSNQTLTAISISNATLSKCGFAGIEISVLSNGGSTGSAINGISVSSTAIADIGRGWAGRRYGTEGNGIRIQADSGAGTINGVMLSTTSITNSAGDGIKLAGETGMTGINRMNIQTSALYGIELAAASAATPHLKLTSSLIHHNGSYGISYNAPYAAGLELYHNTLADNGTINLAIFNQAGMAKIENNIFYGSSAMTDLYAANALAGMVTVNNNCYNEMTNMFGYAGTAYSTIAAFRATGLESNGVGNSSIGLNGDYTPSTSSPCKASGNMMTGVTMDYTGKAYGNPPSSGAYQY